MISNLLGDTFPPDEFVMAIAKTVITSKTHLDWFTVCIGTDYCISHPAISNDPPSLSLSLVPLRK